MKSVKIFFFLWVFTFSGAAYGSAQRFYYDYRNIGGDWRTSIISNRIVLVADQSGQKGYVDIVIPENGYYAVYMYMMHRWNDRWPVIETRTIQNNQRVNKGYLFTEPGSYSHQGRGRWLVKSIDDGAASFFHKGEARIEFELQSRERIRKKQKATIEGEVYLWCIIVVPRGQETDGLMNLIEAERSVGDWTKIAYQTDDQTGLIEGSAGDLARLTINIPKENDYLLAALLRSEGEAKLTVSIRRGNRIEDSKQVIIEKDDFWKAQPLMIRRFEKGSYNLQIENKTFNRIYIDCFLLIPFYPRQSQVDFKLSFSTVFFYHNEKDKDLTEGINRIADVGFKNIDIIAYDDKVGFGDDATEEEIRRIRKRISRLDISVASIHFGYIPLRTEKQALERIQWAVWVARRVGAKRIVSPVSLDIDGDSYITKQEGFRRLSSVIGKVKTVLERHGVELGIENHAGKQWLFNTSDDFFSARTLLSKYVTFVLDEGHFEMAGENPQTVFRRLLPYSRYIHFKSHREDHIIRLVDLMRSFGYSGGVSLEAEKSGFTLDDWFKLYKKGMSGK